MAVPTTRDCSFRSPHFECLLRRATGAWVAARQAQAHAFDEQLQGDSPEAHVRCAMPNRAHADLGAAGAGAMQCEKHLGVPEPAFALDTGQQGAQPVAVEEFEASLVIAERKIGRASW